MAEISSRVSVITVSLGPGNRGDVDCPFMEGICATRNRRHATQVRSETPATSRGTRRERMLALAKFREAAKVREFRGPAKTPNIGDAELETFVELPERDSR